MREIARKNDPRRQSHGGLALCMVCDTYVDMDEGTLDSDLRSYTCVDCILKIIDDPRYMNQKKKNRIMRRPKLNP
jgi:hypothetical protein